MDLYKQLFLSKIKSNGNLHAFGNLLRQTATLMAVHYMDNKSTFQYLYPELYIEFTIARIFDNDYQSFGRV